MKQIILGVAESIGFNRFHRNRSRRRLLGLCYHGVIGDDAPWGDPRTRIAVSKSQFEAQMKELRRFWTPISLSELDHFFRSDRPLPDRSVFVTFDDGYLNNLTIATPILRQNGIPATVFLTTDLIGTSHTIWPLEVFERILQWDESPLKLPGSNGPAVSLPKDPSERLRTAATIINRSKSCSGAECRTFLETLRQRTRFEPTVPWQRELYQMLDWDQARILRDEGIELGAHTTSHCNLARIPVDEVRRELAACKKTMEKELGIDCFSLAYPFGHREAFSDTVVRVASELGFRIATTLCMKRNPEKPDPMRLDRICVTGDLSLHSFRALIAGWRN